MARLLLTTTSFQDTPGPHHEAVEAAGLEIVRERGPLPEARMLELAGEFDGFLCGDDAITAAVIDKSLPRLRVISKYGIGLDKVDVAHATAKGIPVTFCPGVNHTTVAEHVFALMLGLSRKLIEEANSTARGEWKRMTGRELWGKCIGIVGLGRIGKEVAKRARAFGMEVRAFDVYWDEAFAAEHRVTRESGIDEMLPRVDILSLHTNLTPETRGMINAHTLERLKPGALLINCARGELVETSAAVEALRSGRLGGYGTDVLDEEPPPPDHPLLGAPNTIVTPHIGSRTVESVQRQAGMAVRNLLAVLNGHPPEAQANDVPIPSA